MIPHCFFFNDAVNGDIRSTPGAKLDHMDDNPTYSQDLEKYNTIVNVAGNNNYDLNITKQQVKAEMKEQLKMLEKATEARRQTNKSRHFKCQLKNLSVTFDGL